MSRLSTCWALAGSAANPQKRKNNNRVADSFIGSVFLINRVQYTLHVLPNIVDGPDIIIAHKRKDQSLAAFCHQVTTQAVIITECAGFSKNKRLISFVPVFYRSGFSSSCK
jgi:hypothetical protein